MLLSCSFLFTSCVYFGVSSLHFLVSHFLSSSLPVTVIVRPAPSSLTCVSLPSLVSLGPCCFCLYVSCLGLSLFILDYYADPFWTCSPRAALLSAWPLVRLVSWWIWPFWACLFIKWCMKVTTGTHPLRAFSVVNTFKLTTASFNSCCTNFGEAYVRPSQLNDPCSLLFFWCRCQMLSVMWRPLRWTDLWFWTLEMKLIWRDMIFLSASAFIAQGLPLVVNCAVCVLVVWSILSVPNVKR